MLDRVPKAAWFAMGLGILIGFSGLVGWSSAQPPHHHTIKSATHTTENETIQDIAAETVAYYTKVLAWFTGVLAAVSAFQGFLLLRADKTARISADAAKSAAVAAEKGNDLTREIYIADQRPWLLWHIPSTAAVNMEGRHLTIRISGEIQNIGKTPALNVTYFGKFYSPAKGEAALNQGTAFFAQHLQEALSMQFSLANVLPTEKVPMNFTPHGIEISSLPANAEFSLYLAFHAKYQGRLGRVAEIGAVYMLQPFEGSGSRPQKITFNAGEFRAMKSVSLLELPGSRRIT